MRKLKLDITMTTTALVTTTLIIIAGIYDLIAVFFVDDESISISRFMVNAGFDAPAFVFAFAFVCGHCFGYVSRVPAKDLDSQ